MNNKLTLGIDLDDTLITTRVNHRDVKTYIHTDAIKWLNIIQTDFDCTFHLITARCGNYAGREEVRRIVKKIENITHVKFDAIRHTDFKPKGYDAANLGCHFLIDDKVEYLSTCHVQTPSVIPILYGPQLIDVNQYDYKTCGTWGDVYNVLKEFKLIKDNLLVTSYQ